jgi:hypothetical protein
LLRVSLNAIDSGLADFDLYVKAGSPPSQSDFDCKADGPNQFGFCEKSAPATGKWYILVNRFAGSGPYQTTATLFGTDCSSPGQEGQPCDDGNACTQGDVCSGGVCSGTAVTNGAPCEDGNDCTNDACQAGVCTSVPLTGTPCSDGSLCTRNDICQAGTCVAGAAPATDCKQSLVPSRSSLLINDSGNNRDKLVWKWARGQSSTLTDFGNPTTSSTFALCLYDEGGATPKLLAEKVIPTGGGWEQVTSGFQYLDRDAVANGFSKIFLKTGSDDDAKIIVHGKGPNLDVAALGVDQLSSVRVQLVNENACWEARFANTSGGPREFKGRGD